MADKYESVIQTLFGQSLQGGAPGEGPTEGMGDAVWLAYKATPEAERAEKWPDLQQQAEEHLEFQRMSAYRASQRKSNVGAIQGCRGRYSGCGRQLSPARVWPSNRQAGE